MSRMLLFLLLFLFILKLSSASQVERKFYDKKSGLVLLFPSKINMTKNYSDACIVQSNEYKLTSSQRIGCFSLSGNYFNLSLDITVSMSPDVLKRCLTDIPSVFLGSDGKFHEEPNSSSLKKIQIDGNPFVHISFGEGAAGTAYDSDVYRGIVNNQCFSFALLHSYTDGAQFGDNSDNKVEVFYKKMAEIKKIANEIVQSASFKKPLAYSSLK